MTPPHAEAPPIAVMDVADLVVEFVGKRGPGVSFVEIERHLDGLGFPIDGHKALCTAKNVVFWMGMSQPFVQLMQGLVASERLEMKPTIWLTYALDGALPSMPVAVRPPAGGYKKPRWSPVVFNLPDSRKRGRP
jgi:hypothetical protein